MRSISACRGSLLLVLLIVSFSAKAQFADTVAYARETAYKKNFLEAEELLSTFNLTNKNPDAFLLHAQVLYWMNKNDDAKAVYKKTIILFPDNYNVKYEMANFLFATGNLKEAKKQLIEFLQYNPSHKNANLLLAQLYIWNGEIAKAKKITKKFNDQQDQQVADLVEQINKFLSPYIAGGFSFASDDQPMERYRYSVETGWYRSAIFSPVLHVAADNFNMPSRNATTIVATAGNKFGFNYGKTIISTSLGIFQTNKNILPIGEIYFQQKFLLNFSFNAGIKKEPYQYAVASIYEPLTSLTASGGFSYNKNEKWLGKAALERTAFEDGNVLHTAYAWMLLPVLWQKNIVVQAGYGYTYANAVENKFLNEQPLNHVVANHIIYDHVKGVYDPYFTPKNQKISSLLTTIRFNYGKTSLQLKSTIGVFAEIENPTLMLDVKSNNDYYINKSFSKIKYTPYELEGNFTYNINNKISLLTFFNYSSLFFYKRQFAGLQLKYNFFNE